MRNYGSYIYLLPLLFLGLMASCKKEQQYLIVKVPNPQDSVWPIGKDTLVRAEPDDWPTKPQPIAKWIAYDIPAGAHDALQSNFGPFSGDTLIFDLTFDTTALYTSAIPENQADWNKVLGFSHCSTFHQENSVRLVWRHTPNVGIELAGYYYVNSVRSWQIIDTIQVADTVHAKIFVSPTAYQVSINQKTVVKPQTCATRQNSYWLYPYFGGDEVAPQRIIIHIKTTKPLVN